MNRDEFIKWLSEKSSYSRSFRNDDSDWRELQNYAEYIWDELTVNENTVIFNWEEWYFGGREYRSSEYSFEEFIERYENFELRN